MDRWIGRVALVTGASAGIGEATARALVGHGLKVVGCARNIDKLQEIAGDLSGKKGSFHPVQCDLSKRDQIYAMFDAIKREHGGVDVCVNNAAMAFATPILDGEPEEWQYALDVNIIALCLCTKLSVQQMKERGTEGHIVLLNGLSGHRIILGSDLHFYEGMKHMVTALTEGYRDELRQLNSRIRISAISPGFVETEFVPRMHSDDPDRGRQILQSNPSLKPENIAELIVTVLQQPPSVQIHDIVVRPIGQVH